MSEKTTYEELEQRVSELEKKLAERWKERIDSKHSLAVFTGLVEASPDAIIMTDDKQDIIVWNPGAEKLFGYKKEEVLNRDYARLVVPEKIISVREEAFNKVIRNKQLSGPGKTIETEGKRKDGSIFPLEHTVSMWIEAETGTVYIIAILRDITLRKKAEVELVQSEQFYKKQDEILVRLAKSRDLALGRLESFLKDINKIVCETFNVERSSAWFCNEDQSELLCADLYESGPQRHTKGLVLKREDYPSYFKATCHVRQVLVDNAQEDPRTREFLETYLSPLGITSMLDTAFYFKGEIRGILCVEHIGPMRKWKKQEGAFAGALSDLISIAIENSERIKVENELDRHRKDLEIIVEDRTKELNLSLTDAEVARDRIDGILKSIADGLIVTDTYSRVILMNRAAEDILDVRFSEVINRPIDYAIKDETLRDRVKSTLNKEQTGYEFDFELPGSVPKQARIMRARTSVIVDKNKKTQGIVTIIMDVSHEREVDRMKTEFLSTAAHELRTPLTSIQGFSEIILTRDNISPEERKKFLTYINQQAVGLNKIVSDLLDISRIESGRGFALNKQPCEGGSAIKGIVSLFQEKHPERQFEIALPEKLVEIHADKEKMAQVLENLISNAVKYSPEGGKIHVTGKVIDDCFQVSVEDQGMGMTQKQVEKVFDKFYRVDASNTSIEGTGLGMSIVKYIVEAHGGKVWVESEYGKGTTVTFRLPL